MSYSKLDSGIIHSSIWSEDDRIVRLWITLLAMKQFDGRVESSIPGLARAANIPIEDCERGLKKLMSPDPYSRSKEHDGRRITEIEGGWFVLNHEKYRDKRDRADYYRKWRAQRAAQQKAQQKDCAQPHTDTDTDTDINNMSKPKPLKHLFQVFEQSRALYPGAKRGLETEFKDFKKKHSDWKKVLPLIQPAIEKEIAYKQGLVSSGQFCPQWKNFKTWLNQRCWEAEYPDPIQTATREMDEDEARKLFE